MDRDTESGRVALTVALVCARLAVVLAVPLSLLTPAPGRGDTTDASSTTMAIVRDRWSAGTSETIAPLYELLSVAARDVGNPLAENLQVVVSGWGALSLGSNLVWYDVTAPKYRAFGDLDLAYLQGEVLSRSLQVRLGRTLVGGGVTGALQLDGGNVILRLPYGLGISGYVGSPVQQRFNGRGGDETFNPHRGNFAAGGRAYWTVPRWGEVGASVVQVSDHGDPSRQQVGGDVRVTPIAPLTVLASAGYDLHEERWPEMNVVGQYRVVPKLLVSADYRHVEPDLLLARTSILSVFANDRRNEVGAGAQYGPWNAVVLSGDYHYLKRTSDGGGHGNRATGRAVWRSETASSLGAELGYNSFYSQPSGAFLNNGYFVARAFGSHRFRQLTGTLDLQEYAFRQEINGQKNSFTAIATLACALGRGFSALLSADAGATPYFSSQLGFMAKLSYAETYLSHEVRR